MKDTASLANRLPDSRWKEAAKSLNLAARGLDALRDPAVRKRLEDGYLSYRWRTSLDGETPGVADALYVRERAAGGAAPSVYEVLGNAALRRVVPAPRAVRVTQGVRPAARRRKRCASRA